jgi:hypothetical protein
LIAQAIFVSIAYIQEIVFIYHFYQLGMSFAVILGDHQDLDKVNYWKARLLFGSVSIWFFLSRWDLHVDTILIQADVVFKLG